MASVNRVILVGHLGQDPIVQPTNSGQFTRVSLATSNRWTDQQGNKQEATEWWNLNFNGKSAETAAKWLRKGMMIYIEGQMRTTRGTNQNGVEQTYLNVRVDNFTMLGGFENQNSQDNQQNYQNNQNNQHTYQRNAMPAPQGQQMPPMNGQPVHNGYQNHAPQGNQQGNMPHNQMPHQNNMGHQQPMNQNGMPAHQPNMQGMPSHAPSMPPQNHSQPQGNMMGHNPNQGQHAPQGGMNQPQPGVVDDDVPFNHISNPLSTIS